MQRFGVQRVGPTDQGGIIGRWFPEQATEPAQHQALVHPIFGLLMTPSGQVLEQQHTQEDFRRRGMASMHQGVAMPFAKVVAHLVVPLVIVEQLIQLLQHRVDPSGHLRHARKDIFFGVAIDQHAQTPPCTYFFFYPYSITFPAFFHTVTFPSLVHMVSSRPTCAFYHSLSACWKQSMSAIALK